MSGGATDDRRRSDEDQAVLKTLEHSYTNPLIREAREAQDRLLRPRYEGKSLRFADIGCGTGYHGSIFGPSAEAYHGFEISPATAEIARNRWAEEGVAAARVTVGDVATADLDPEGYDVAFCLYFTPGNFRDPSDDLGLYTDGYLDRNPVFVEVFGRFVRALRPGGRLFMCVYRDVPAAEEAQWDFYLNTGQHPITPRGTRFVATRERFWSVRFTRESMLSNLAACGVEAEQVEFHELNPIAWLVEVRVP